MYTTISPFLKDWKYESDSTIKMLDNLTEDSLNQKVTPDGRSLGFIAWHLSQTIPEMMGKTGLRINGPAIDAPMPNSSKEIKEAYEKSSKSFIDQIEKEWNDESLKTEDEMYGNKWSRGLTLLYLLLHEAHHRGQMTVLMRQAGSKVPGVYGPSKEEWTEFGMEPMK